MRKLELSKKTGFKVNDIYKPVVIRDFRGVLFYSTEPFLPRVKEFNLPGGTYFVDSGYFTPMVFPVQYKYIKLPLAQRLLPKPTDFKIMFGNNPRKCTIYWDKKYILFDNSFREKPLNQLYFILFHEWGHSIYKTETYADLYAANCMLGKGFNPSQVGEAPVNSLSDASMDRKEIVVSKLLNAQQW